MSKVMFKMTSGLTVVGSVEYSSLLSAMQHDYGWIQLAKVAYPMFACRDELVNDSDYIDDFATINLRNVGLIVVLSKGDSNE